MGSVGLDNKSRDKRPVVFLVFLLIVIIILIVSIVFVKVNEKSSPFDPDDQQVENIEAEEVVSGDVGIEYMIERYDKLIEQASNEEELASVFENEINDIMNIDIDRRYGYIVLRDSINLDNITQTIDSAVNVVNVASYYGDEDTYDKYLEIVRDREVQNGIDINMESRG